MGTNYESIAFDKNYEYAVKRHELDRLRAVNEMQLRPQVILLRSSARDTDMQATLMMKML